ATGAWKMKIARHSKSWVRTPPSAGPSAAPKVALAVQIRAPRAAEPASAPRSGSAAASSIAAPRPWRHRKTIKAGRLHAAAQPTEASVNRASPTRAMCSTSTRAITGNRQNETSATTRLYDVITQDTPTIDVSKAPYRSGRARTTIEESAKATATETATAAVSTPRCGLGRIPLHEPLTGRSEAD